MVPGFPVPIPGIVFLTAAPIFSASFDYDFLKIIHEKHPVIPQECLQFAGFSEIEVCFAR
jgi:hypothetical protein